MKNTFMLTAIVAVILLAVTQCSLPWINKINPEDENTWNWTTDFNEEVAAEYKEIGRKVLKTSFLTLTSEVSNAMKEGGVQHAVRYCNLKAYPLIDSLSEQYNVSIKRVAQKYRNPDNLMRPFEQELFMDYDSRNKQKESIMDKVVLSSDNYLEYYAPIILTSPCMACHGSPGVDMSDEDYQMIKALYPEDRATGFVPGDLRGMWRIRFMPEKP
jgi:hypothetical protein